MVILVEHDPYEPWSFIVIYSMTSRSAVVILIVHSRQDTMVTECPWSRAEILRSVQDGEETEIESTDHYLSRLTNFAVNSFPMGFVAFTTPMAIVIDIGGDYIILGDFIVNGTVRRYLSSLMAFSFFFRAKRRFPHQLEVPILSGDFFT